MNLDARSTSPRRLSRLVSRHRFERLAAVLSRVAIVAPSPHHSAANLAAKHIGDTEHARRQQANNPALQPEKQPEHGHEFDIAAAESLLAPNKLIDRRQHEQAPAEHHSA